MLAFGCPLQAVRFWLQAFGYLLQAIVCIAQSEQLTAKSGQRTADSGQRTALIKHCNNNAICGRFPIFYVHRAPIVLQMYAP